MKKHLLSTSAIALGVAAAAPASAQEWTLSWGGFYNAHVAWVDASGTGLPAGADYDGVDTFTTGEIIFTPSVTLDNGLTFGINVQLEAQATAGAQIDESYVTISGDNFGRIEIGNENSAGYKSMVAAPEVTSLAINSPSISTFLPNTAAGLGFGFRGAMASAYTEVGRNNDVNRISYYTPSFNGFTVGVSYASRNAATSNSTFSVNKNGVLSDIFDIGASYSQTFGTTSVTLGARYGTASQITGVAASDPEVWAVGAQVGFGDFTVGGHYAEDDNGVAGGAGDQRSWSFGVTYDAPGAWSFEALAFMGENDNGPGVADSEYNAYRIGASRDLGPGVDWDIYAIQAEIDAPVVAGTDVKATIIGTGINLSF